MSNKLLASFYVYVYVYAYLCIYSHAYKRHDMHNPTGGGRRGRGEERKEDSTMTMWYLSAKTNHLVIAFLTTEYFEPWDTQLSPRPDSYF